MVRTVVAGLDGSPESLSAAGWAAREAVSRRLPLRLIHAWEWQPYNYDTRGSLADPDETRHWAEAIPREASAALRLRYRGGHADADAAALAGEGSPTSR
ncbi:universal stress protein [Streptomyces sp. NBC_01477]|uniref:universal stress protein n=1 Tax=Streptomyces sp. NBC_01477 TaxID=2976015 RepID=UPI002E320E69|nr:universal stress protein [Streptomyces sp. NBC_01477]